MGITALIFLAALAAIALATSFLGVVEFDRANIFVSRLTRAAVAAIVGAALATAGMALQGMLRNALAEPYVLGISSGAGVGVVMGKVFVPLACAAWLTTPALAFAGAMLTCGVVYGVAQRHGRLDPYVLLLTGVVVNVLNGAIMLAVMMVLKPNDVVDFVGWGMGRVPEDLWFKGEWFRGDLLVVCAVGVLAGWAVLLLRGGAFNALGLGDDVAATSGVRVHWLRVETFFIVSLMTACAVALVGPIGFVGLIVPHLCRLIVGPDNRRLAIVCGFSGAIFLVLADTLCRTTTMWLGVSGRVELPLGIITAACGGPFFIFLLRRRLREVR